MMISLMVTTGTAAPEPNILEKIGVAFGLGMAPNVARPQI